MSSAIFSARYKRCGTYAMITFLILASYIADTESASLPLDFNGTAENSAIPWPWHVRQHAGKADIDLISEDGESILHLRCNEASFSVERDISVDLMESPYMSWTWKVVKMPLRGDVRKKGHDDQALQILLAFENRKVLSYVWDSNAPAGTVTDGSVGWPVNLIIKIFVIKSGTADLGKWVTQTRNIYEDYINTFHELPGRLRGVRIQTNTQYTKGSAEGFVKGILFRKDSQKARARQITFAEAPADSGVSSERMQGVMRGH